MKIRTSSLVLALTAALAPTAFSQSPIEVYVDAVDGRDFNTGGTPQTAFQTIKRALQFVEASQSSTTAPFQIFAAPGRYDASIGEVYPIRLSERVGLYGPSTGVGVAVLDAGGAASGVVAERSTSFLSTRLQNLTVTNAATGVTVEPAAGSLERRDLFLLRVHDCSTGIEVRGPGSETIVIRLATIEDCDVGLVASDGARVQMDGVVEDCVSDGVRLVGDGLFEFRGEVSRCGRGFDVESGSSGTTLGLTQAVIQDTAQAVRLRRVGAAEPELFLGRATLAGNAEAIVVEPLTVPAGSILWSILASNGADAPNGVGTIVATDSIVPSGAVTGAGVLAVDPLFVDPAASDFRLLRSSPAIDQVPASAVFNGFDGDLDADPRPDYGGLEYATLRRTGVAQIASTVPFEIDGFAGAMGVGLLNAFGSTTIMPTIYGDLNLNPVGLRRVQRIPFSGPTATWDLAIPFDLNLIGRTWAVQAWVQSPLSPSGGAFSSFELFVIQ